MSIAHVVDINDQLGRAMHNSASRALRRELAALGWLNPDGVGVVYSHPKLRDPETKELIWIIWDRAITIQEAWENMDQGTGHQKTTLEVDA